MGVVGVETAWIGPGVIPSSHRNKSGMVSSMTGNNRPDLALKIVLEFSSPCRIRLRLHRSRISTN